MADPQTAGASVDLRAALEALKRRFPAAWNGRKPGSVVLLSSRYDAADMHALCAVFRSAETAGLLHEEQPRSALEVAVDALEKIARSEARALPPCMVPIATEALARIKGNPHG